MPMTSGANPVRFIALKKSAQRRGWAAWERPMITRVKANQASMYGATVGLLERLVSRKITDGLGFAKSIFWYPETFGRNVRSRDSVFDPNSARFSEPTRSPKRIYRRRNE